MNSLKISVDVYNAYSERELFSNSTKNNLIFISCKAECRNFGEDNIGLLWLGALSDLYPRKAEEQG